MSRVKMKQKVELTLKSSIIRDKDGEFRGGGILNSTAHVADEMWVEFMDDPVMDRDTDRWGVTGRHQVHLGTTRRALEEFAVFLLSLAHYRPPEPGYTAHFELTDPEHKPSLHLVVHLPVEEPNYRPRFAKVHNVGTATISDEEGTVDTTLPALFPEETNAKEELSEQ